MTLVCRPTPIVQFHPVERALLTDSTIGWHLSKDADGFTRRNDLLRNRRNIIQLGRCTGTGQSVPQPVLACGRGGHSSPCLKAGAFWPQEGKNSLEIGNLSVPEVPRAHARTHARTGSPAPRRLGLPAILEAVVP